MFTQQQLPSQHRRCPHNNICHHNRGVVNMTTVAITAQMFTQQQLPSQQMSTRQQLPSQHRRCSHDNSYHHSTGDSHDNSCHHSTGDVHTTTATITAQEILLLLLKKIGNARPGEGDCHPISPKTPAPHYQPIEEKKRKGK